PVTSAARDHYLAARLPLYPAVAWLNREGGSDSTVYAFFAEDMTYFAQGTLLGDWHGPARFAELLPDLGDPEALWRHLRWPGVAFRPVPSDRGVLRLPEGPAWSRRFRPVYADPHARVFALDGGTYPVAWGPNATRKEVVEGRAQGVSFARNDPER